MVSKSRLKSILSLKLKKYRDEQNLFLIEGYRLCQEALLSDFSVETLLICDDLLSPQKLKEIVQLARYKQIEVIEIQPSEVKRLADTVNSQGIFCIVQQQRLDLEAILNKENKIIVIIDEGQDPGNMGTIIRTCDWFGVDAVLLSEGTVELYNPKVIRSTMGSIFHLPIVEDVDLKVVLPRLKQPGFHIFAADANGDHQYNQVDYLMPIALVIGNENRGIKNDLFNYVDKTIKIPSYGKAESLNMATAAAIIISRIVN
jgi:TrmH family RNA methyltransferase